MVKVYYTIGLFFVVPVFFPVVYYQTPAVCYDNIHGHIMLLCGNILPYELEVISHTYFGGGCG